VACGPGGTDYNWIEVILKNIGTRMDAYGQHYYVRGTGTWGRNQKGSATDFDETEWFALMKNTMAIDDIIRRNKELLDQYDPKGRIDLYIDEWGTWWDEEPGTKGGFLYQQNTLRDAVSAGIFLNEFNKHCDRVKMCNIAQINNVLQAMILTKGKEMILTPTYHVFEMYKVHQGAKLLKSDLTCNSYKRNEEVLPALNISTSKTDDGIVHISICNLDPTVPAGLECKVEGMNVKSVNGRILTSEKMNAHNTFSNPNGIKPQILKDIDIENNTISVTIPEKSIVVLQIR
jgi:alpha-N-arabinofuranosidase